MLAGAERHARSDDPGPGPYPEPRDGERAVIHDAIPDGDLARRRSVMEVARGAEAVAVVSRCVGESHVQITSIRSEPPNKLGGYTNTKYERIVVNTTWRNSMTPWTIRIKN